MSLHLKRLASPKAWHIPKKAATWAPKPLPGPHGADESIPLGLVLRDYLKHATRASEAKRIIHAGQILLDGREAFSTKQVVGFMDVVSIPKNEEHYRVLFDYHGRVILHAVSAQNATWKLCRIEDKRTVDGGKFQLNLHDGRNVLLKDAAQYKTGDSIKLHVPDQKIMGHYAFAKGSQAVITGGAHISESAMIESVEVTRSPKPNLVALKSPGGEGFTTIKPYVFVIGKEKAEITMPSAMGGM